MTAKSVKSKNGGGKGRPSNALRERCRAYLAKASTWKGVDDILTTDREALYLDTLKFLADRGYGKPVESVEVSGAGGEPLRVIYADE